VQCNHSFDRLLFPLIGYELTVLSPKLERRGTVRIPTRCRLSAPGGLKAQHDQTPFVLRHRAEDVPDQASRRIISIILEKCAFTIRGREQAATTSLDLSEQLLLYDEIPSEAVQSTHGDSLCAAAPDRLERSGKTASPLETLGS
jgi:hypothetical protein